MVRFKQNEIRGNMKSFKDINIQDEYRTYTTNIIRDFYIPVLSCSVLYQRAVGFFSSSSMIQLLDGLESLVKNGGKIQLVVSPKLSEKDIEAIATGYKSRDEVIDHSITDIIDDVRMRGHERRLYLLSKLIEQGYVDIKVAFLSKNNSIGMFHEKLGIMTDHEENYLAFSGSLNESETAFSINYESFDVFRSWIESEKDKAQSKKVVFQNMWINNEKGIDVIEFPKVALSQLRKITYEYTQKYGESDLLDEIEVSEEHSTYLASNVPKIPDDLEIRDYQQAAIDNWKFNDYVGIFDMATGAGKTITGIYGLTTLFNNMRRLPVIIVAPYTHLVEQWVEDLEWFNIKPIIGYSHSNYRNYKNDLRERLVHYKFEASNFLCFITTNASFRTKSVQEIVELFPDETLIIIDEAHNFGSKLLSLSLPSRFSYRMALSATINRHNDQEGTEFLYSYFKQKVIEYTLERAIREDKLSQYKYYPQLTYLSEDEFNDYNAITAEIAKCIKNEKGKIRISEAGKMLLLKRSRLIAGAVNKVSNLMSAISDYSSDDGILIYSGATNLINDDVDEEEIRMIDMISNQLHKTFGMITSRFTAQEDKQTRKRIIEYFVQKDIQAIVAIKCLDEGVNIPSIKTAFILASSTNPKEYVQRRGRVLRKSSNKSFAEIFDFIVLPRDIEVASVLTDAEKSQDYGLVKRELKRVFEFTRLSMNSYLGYQFIHKILEAYKGISFEQISMEGENLEIL